MCGRISQHRYQDYLRVLEIGEAGELIRRVPPRFNVAPSLEVLACRVRPTGERELVPLIWGLLPRWVKDPSKVSHPINARVETVQEKPMFRDSFTQGRRCLIPADGFYEWKREGKKKRPFFVRLKSGEPMVIAGLWDHWEYPEAQPVDSFTILVGPANELVAPLHDRMPIILRPEEFDRWLDRKQDAKALLGMLRPYPDAELEVYPVSDAVSNPRNEGEELIRRINIEGDGVPV